MSPPSAEDIEAIKQLKYRYLRTLDLKRWDEFAECFVPEATGDYDGLAFEDRSSLVEYMRANLGEGLITMHHVHHPEIAVDGELATGRWYLEDKVIVSELDFVLEGAAFYDRPLRAYAGRLADRAHRLSAYVRGEHVDGRPGVVQGEAGYGVRQLSRGAARYCRESAHCENASRCGEPRRATPAGAGAPLSRRR